ncbi:nitrite reductase small subunit NirD [Neptuniibacter halophilus]|uniref:nitrite reductase small subunit NirD n=1 Tax=Neptuniibacter halophilus TaxID=651666 RepID=UPI0025745309|nr:nitrite reductase small subunit NirD [Neptuniibacter halophilus]
MTANPNANWTRLCNKTDLVQHSGVAALYEGQQVALFYIPGYQEEVYAIGNQDPFSGANVLARGLIGDLGGEIMVASPLYKQHFSLSSGQCLEDPETRVPVWPVRLNGEQVEILQA